MFAVFMFGSEVERLFGAKRYLIYYLTCVVGAALMHLIVIYAAREPAAAPDGRRVGRRVRLAARVRHGVSAHAS